MSILVEKRNSALILTLNRPEVRNAFDEEVIASITSTFKALVKDRDLRAVVIRGNGPDFCAGADIRWMRRAAGYKPAQNKKDASRLVGMCRAIDECPVPVIVRVHGSCFGGGLGIVAASDIAVASNSAVMAFSECRLGIIPAVVSSFVIPKIGTAQARRYFLTAETFGSGVAMAIGLVHEVVQENELDVRIDSLLHSILRAGPSAVREAKALIRQAAPLPYEKRIQFTISTLARIRATDEAKEGLGAFLGKRKPSWVTAHEIEAHSNR